MSFNGELLEIFSWLPTKTLFRLSTLCKDSSKLLEQDFFIRKHCDNMPNTEETDFFVDPHSGIGCDLELHSTHEDAGESGHIIGLNVPLSSLRCLLKNARIMASSNGLICCQKLDHEPGEPSLFICNPVTRDILYIPFNPGNEPVTWNNYYNHVKVVFLCDTEVGGVLDQDFLLMRFYSLAWGNRITCQMYSLKDKAWGDASEIYVGPRNIVFDTKPPCVDGAAYFLSDTGEYIRGPEPFQWPYVVLFNVKTRQSTIIPIPEITRDGVHDRECKLGLFKWSSPKSGYKSICLVKLNKSIFEVWVLRDRSENPWDMVLKKGVMAMGICEEAAGFSVLNGNTLVITTRERIYKYPLEVFEGKAIEVCRHKCGKDEWGGIGKINLYQFFPTLRPASRQLSV